MNKFDKVFNNIIKQERAGRPTVGDLKAELRKLDYKTKLMVHSERQGDIYPVRVGQYHDYLNDGLVIEAGKNYPLVLTDSQRYYKWLTAGALLRIIKCQEGEWLKSFDNEWITIYTERHNKQFVTKIEGRTLYIP